MAPNLRLIEHLFSSSSKAPKVKKKKGSKLHNGLQQRRLNLIKFDTESIK